MRKIRRHDFHCYRFTFTRK